MNHAGSERTTLVCETNSMHQRGARDRRRNKGLALCVAILVAVLVAAIVAGQQMARAAEVRPEAENMTLSGSAVLVHSDVSASGGKDVAYFTEGSASTPFSGELTSVNLRARETYCGGNARLRIFVDGIEKGTVDLTSSTYGNYPLAIMRVGAGSHQMRIDFINDRMTNKCDRNAFLDYVTLTTTDSTMPTPTTPPQAADNPFAGEEFYVNPNSNARRTADQWYANGRAADAEQLEKIARNGDIFYFSEWTQNAPGGTPAHVDWQTDQIKAAGALPVYGVYAVPHRDCGAYSSGGFTTGDQYKVWINDIVAGLQGRKAVVIVEPDGISSTDCLTSAQLQERF